jgi:hypothetical protein
MTFDADFINRLIVGNLSYVLLVISMMMTRMLLLRLIAIGSGMAGLAYAIFWLSDPVIIFWEAVFTLVNIVQTGLMTYRNQLARFNDEERMFYDRIVPDLEPRQVRRLLCVGIWLDAEPGTELIRQGEPVSHLVFLRSGKASVLVHKNLIGTCTEGSLAGEIGISTGEPATATVIVQETVRYLALERHALHNLMKVDPDIARAIDQGNLRNLENKLITRNKAVSASARL